MLAGNVPTGSVMTKGGVVAMGISGGQVGCELCVRYMAIIVTQGKMMVGKMVGKKILKN
jgi:hypothetical protein